MSISESPIDDELLGHIQNAAKAGARLIDVDTGQLTSADIVHAVDEAIYAFQKGVGVKLVDDEDPSLLLGSLWGEQICRELGWTWSGAIFHNHDDSHAVGVFSPDRSLAIYPFHFLTGCLANQAPVTVELSFRMLLEGSDIPKLPANSFENVMDNCHHIVPRD